MRFEGKGVQHCLRLDSSGSRTLPRLKTPSTGRFCKDLRQHPSYVANIHPMWPTSILCGPESPICTKVEGGADGIAAKTKWLQVTERGTKNTLSHLPLTLKP